MTVSVDPLAFLNQTGTVAATLSIQSGPAINVIPSVRVMVNNAGPNQVGSFISVPGTLHRYRRRPGPQSLLCRAQRQKRSAGL